MNVKNDKVDSLKDIYGDKISSFLESTDKCYNDLINSEFPETIWVRLQYEKEKFLKELASSGLNLSDEVNDDINWQNIVELLVNSESIHEYPISLACGFEDYNKKIKFLNKCQRYQTIMNNFSPKWGVNAGFNDKTSSKSYNNNNNNNNNKITRMNEKNTEYNFCMDENQWMYACYEVLILCKDLLLRNIGEIKLYLTRLEEGSIKKKYSDVDVNITRIGSRTGDNYKKNTTISGKSFTEENIDNKVSMIPKPEYDNCDVHDIHSKLTNDYENLNVINSSLGMFLEMVRIKFGIDHYTHYLISRLMSRSDHGGMGFYSSEMIHPLDTRYRVLLLLESWNKADTVDCESTIWGNGKLRIKPGGAPRITPKLTNSNSLVENVSFKNWVNRQIHIIYSNLAFKLQRILLFIPPGWLHYMPGDIDLKDMNEYRKNYWLNSKIKLNKNTELSSLGIKSVMGNNPQLLYEYLLESISILNFLKMKIEGGIWGDLSYLKNINEKENGKEKINRLLKLMSAIERLDYAVRRDFSNNAIKDSKLLINASFYCLSKTHNSINNFNLSNNIHMDNAYKSQQNLCNLFEDNYNKRQYIYKNEYIRDSIEEKLLILPKLSSYWMYEVHIIHTIINYLMKVNVVQIDQNNREFCSLSSMGLHFYSPFITRCILFIGRLLENGVYDLDDISCDISITKTGVIPITIETYSIYLVSNIWECYNNYMKMKSMNSNMNNKFEQSENKIVYLFFSLLKLILTDFSKYIKYTNIVNLLDELNESSTADNEIGRIKTNDCIKETNNNIQKSFSGSNLRYKIHSNSKEFLKRLSKGGNSHSNTIINNIPNNEMDDSNNFEECDEDNRNLNKFTKINNYINYKSTSSDLIFQLIYKKGDTYWQNPDWLLSFSGLTPSLSFDKKNSKQLTENNLNNSSSLNNLNFNEYHINENVGKQLWKVFGISLTTSSRLERVYNDILLRKLNTLLFRSELFYLCQHFFELKNPQILRILLYIIKRINKLLIYKDSFSELNFSNGRNTSEKTVELDKTIWVRYCNYCILRSNERIIRDLFEVPLQMLKLPATHYLELKSRTKILIEEKERIEKLAKQELQGCIDTFIHSFKYLEDVYIYETITNWSNIIFEEADLLKLDDSPNLKITNNWNRNNDRSSSYYNLIKNYSLILVRLFDVYIPYFLQELMNSDYWDLKMIKKVQFDELIKCIITIDKYILIIRNWLEFNIDKVYDKGVIIDNLMMFNHNCEYIINNNLTESSSIKDRKIKEMMRKRYLNNEKTTTLFNLFMPQLITLIQNRLNGIEYLIYQAYKNSKKNAGEWIKGINVPNIHTSSIMIDIGTIVNTGIESLLEWMNFPIEGEESLTLMLTPIMKFYRDITAFIINTIRKELSSKKYELLLTYIHYITDIILVLYKNGIVITTNNLNSNVLNDMRSLIKLHNIHKLLPVLNNQSNNTNENGSNRFEEHCKEYNSENNTGKNNTRLNEQMISYGNLNLNYLFSHNDSNYNNDKYDFNNVIVGLLNEKYDKNGIFYTLIYDCLKENNNLSGRKGVVNGKCLEKDDNNDVKFLVSIHNLYFFKNILFETSQKIISLVFGNGEDNAVSKYILSDNSLSKMKQLLKYFRNYGAMDNDENKLLSTDSYIELNNLLFLNNNSINIDKNGTTCNNEAATLRHKNLFINLINECIENLNKFIINIVKISTVKVISNNYGFDFFLRLYNNMNYIENIDDNHTSNNYSNSINNVDFLTIENIIHNINNYFRYFITQCPFYNNNSVEIQKDGEYFDSDNYLMREYDRSYMNTIILLWLNQLFEMYLFRSTKYLHLISVFENDFEIFDEMRRSYNINDYINKDKNYRLSDLILYFITQIFKNKKILQNRIFKELTYTSLVSNNIQNNDYKEHDDYLLVKVKSECKNKNSNFGGVFSAMSTIRNITHNIDSLIKKGSIYTGNNNNGVVSKIIKGSNKKK